MVVRAAGEQPAAVLELVEVSTAPAALGRHGVVAGEVAPGLRRIGRVAVDRRLRHVLEAVDEPECVAPQDHDVEQPPVPGRERLDGVSESHGRRSAVLGPAHRDLVVLPLRAGGPVASHPRAQEVPVRAVELRVARVDERFLELAAGLVEQALAHDDAGEAVVKPLGRPDLLHAHRQVGQVAVHVVGRLLLRRRLGQEHAHRAAERLEVLRVRSQLRDDARGQRALAAEPRGQGADRHGRGLAHSSSSASTSSRSDSVTPLALVASLSSFG